MSDGHDQFGIARHNREAFFLNRGDMLIKAGDWQTAQKIYANAKYSPEQLARARICRATGYRTSEVEVFFV